MKLVGERRALAAVIFAFYFLQYLMAVLMGQIPPEYANAFAAIAGVYGLAFFSLVAGYFWARWYSVGVGLYGVIIGIVAVYKEGTEPVYQFSSSRTLGGADAVGRDDEQAVRRQTAWRLKAPWMTTPCNASALGHPAGVSLRSSSTSRSRPSPRC